jgi:hypothetical protein
MDALMGIGAGASESHGILISAYSGRSNGQNLVRVRVRRRADTIA